MHKLYLRILPIDSAGVDGVDTLLSVALLSVMVLLSNDGENVVALLPALAASNSAVSVLGLDFSNMVSRLAWLESDALVTS